MRGDDGTRGSLLNHLDLASRILRGYATIDNGGGPHMKRERFLYVLAGALVATVLSLGASQGDDRSDYIYQPHNGNADVYHSASEHKIGDPGDAYYRHAHDGSGDHRHNCRATGKTDAKTGKQTLECQGHDGN
jgi:hypothetical protein